MASDWKVTWRRAVYQSPLHPAEKVVVLALAEYADWITGEQAHPGDARLMKDTGASRATVHRALKNAIDLGLVIRHSRGNNSPAGARAAVYSIAQVSTCRGASVNVSRAASQRVVTDPLPTPTPTPTSISQRVVCDTRKVAETVQDLHPEVTQDLHPEVTQDLHPEVTQDLHPEVTQDLHPEDPKDGLVGHHEVVTSPKFGIFCPKCVKVVRSMSTSEQREWDAVNAWRTLDRHLHD